MSLTTYTLVVRENESEEGIVAELRGDGTIENSTRISYGDYGLMAVRDDWTPDEQRTEITADVRTTRLQTQRNGGEFQFRVLGDGETLTEQRITDDEWRVATAE
ncbi:hypothetical protein [Haladaptatus sp. NG-SE-30]